MPEPVRIDLGCGNVKREGYVGLDYVAGDDVDHVLDLTHDRYPFDDSSVDEVFSAQLAIALVRRGYRQLAGRSLVGDGRAGRSVRWPAEPGSSGSSSNCT